MHSLRVSGKMWAMELKYSSSAQEKAKIAPQQNHASCKAVRWQGTLKIEQAVDDAKGLNIARKCPGLS